MDRLEYLQKMETKLSDTTTYVEIHEDPTYKIQAELRAELNVLLACEQITPDIYNTINPRGTQVPRMFGQPKIYKKEVPLREVVDSNGGVTRGTNGHLAQIIKHYEEENEYSVLNSTQLVDSIKDVKVEEDETLVSFDVVALYPSVPQDEALQLINEKLVHDENLHDRAKIPAEKIMKLLKICVENTYFHFNGKMYKQVNGLAIGAPTSGFAAGIFMHRLEKRALATFAHAPPLWKRYVDDILSKIKKHLVDLFLAHLNTMHERIKFTHEDMIDRMLPFLEVEIHINDDGSLKFKIYRKPTHTNQYLMFDSNHHINHKLGVVATLNHRANVLITEEDDKKEEEQLLKIAMRNCK